MVHLAAPFLLKKAALVAGMLAGGNTLPVPVPTGHPHRQAPMTMSEFTPAGHAPAGPRATESVGSMEELLRKVQMADVLRTGFGIGASPSAQRKHLPRSGVSTRTKKHSFRGSRAHRLELLELVDGVDPDYLHPTVPTAEVGHSGEGENQLQQQATIWIPEPTTAELAKKVADDIAKYDRLCNEMQISSQEDSDKAADACNQLLWLKVYSSRFVRSVSTDSDTALGFAAATVPDLGHEDSSSTPGPFSKLDAKEQCESRGESVACPMHPDMWQKVQDQWMANTDGDSDGNDNNETQTDASVSGDVDSRPYGFYYGEYFLRWAENVGFDLTIVGDLASRSTYLKDKNRSKRLKEEYIQ